MVFGTRLGQGPTVYFQHLVKKLPKLCHSSLYFSQSWWRLTQMLARFIYWLRRSNALNLI